MDETFNYYNARLRPNARSLRKSMTKAELHLWKNGLRAKMRGVTFNRQRPVLHFIADFMSKQLKLIIEVDGLYHNSPEMITKDKDRDERLMAAGFTILRFTNEEVLNNIEEVIEEIDKKIEELKKSLPENSKDRVKNK